MEQPAERPSPRILIVDDQLSNVRLLEHTLRRAGFLDVTSTTDPCAVTNLHLEHAYDLILLDLQMPEMNGFDVMQQLRTTTGEDPGDLRRAIRHARRPEGRREQLPQQAVQVAGCGGARSVVASGLRLNQS